MIRIAVVAGTLALAGCAQPGFEANPVTRNFSWFSDLAARDVEAACTDGKTRARLVYNGRYDEQIRRYDLVPTEAGWTLEVSVRGHANPLNLSTRDLWQPWRARVASVPVDQATWAPVASGLDRAQAAPRVPTGSDVLSDDLYWLAAECRDGQFRYSAWKVDDWRPEQPAFVAALLALDPLGIPLQQEPSYAGSRDRAEGRFRITVR